MAGSLARTLRLSIIGEDGATAPLESVGRSAKKMGDKANQAGGVFGKAMSGMQGAAGAFGISMGGAGTAIDAFVGHMSGSISSGKTWKDKMVGFGKAVALGIGAAALAIGAQSVTAAIAFDDIRKSLEASVNASGGSWDKFKGQLGGVEDKFAKLGFTADDVEQALAGSVVATGDSQKSIDRLSIAADLARFKHISLSDATLTVNKAFNGQLRPLKQLGIDLPITAGGANKLAKAHDKLQAATDKVNQMLAENGGAIDSTSSKYPAYQAALEAQKGAQDDVTSATGASSEIVGALSDKLGGQAAANAETFTGKVEALKSEFHNLKIKIGEHLIPILESMVDKFNKIADWISKHKGAMQAFGVLVGVVLTGAFIMWAAAMWQAAAALWATGIPEAILLIVIGIAIVVAELWLLWWVFKHVWKYIKQYAVDAWHWIEDNVIHPIVHTFTKTLPHALEKVVKWFKEMPDKVGKALANFVDDVWKKICIGADWIDEHVWTPIKNFFTGLPGKIKHAAVGMWDGIKDAFKDALNWLIDKWNGLEFKIPSVNFGIFHTPSFTLGLPDIPHLAMGGTAMASMMHLVGERGPELFIPQTTGTVIPASRTADMLSQMSHSQTSVIVNAETNADPHRIAAEIGWALRNVA